MVTILSKAIINQTVKTPPQNVPKPDPPGNATPGPLETDPFERLATELTAIRVEMLELEAAEFAKLETLHHTQTQSARNLIHYLALRRHDRRHIQEELSLQGLSSLGRAESHVKASIDAIAALLRRLTKHASARRLPVMKHRLAMPRVWRYLSRTRNHCWDQSLPIVTCGSW